MRRWGAGRGAHPSTKHPQTAERTMRAAEARRGDDHDHWSAPGVRRPPRTLPVLVGLRPARVKQRWCVLLDPPERPPALAAYRAAPPLWDVSRVTSSPVD